jgi:GT2 family glycosyltransferase
MMAIDESHPDHVTKAANPRRLRRLILSAARSTIGPIPLLGPTARYGLSSLRSARKRANRVWDLSKRLAARRGDLPTLVEAWKSGGVKALRDQVRLLAGVAPTKKSASEWLKRVQPSPTLLSRFRRTEWSACAPWFTILTPVYNVREEWLRSAVTSVLSQTYRRWELILINDASSAPHITPTLNELAGRDPRVKVIHLSTNSGVSKATNVGLDRAEGDYVAFLDHDDHLEPHALHRFAQAALAYDSDLIFSDEAVTSEDISEILSIPLRTAFSYDYYLCHPYFVHLIAVKTGIIRRVGGIDETMTVSQDVDLVLRLIEHSRRITHVPEVLYRWRMHGASLSHRQFDLVQNATRGALERHLSRIGADAEVEDRTHHNFRDIRFRPRGSSRLAILVIPSGDPRRTDLRLQHITGTFRKELAEMILVDGHERDHFLPIPGVNSRGWDADRSPRSQPAMLNEAVSRLDSNFTHYLFLDSELEPLSAGWLEHLLGFATRGDVGAVGPLVIDPACRIRHAGLITGVLGPVGHAFQGADFRMGEHNRNAGRNGELLCTRDVAAVSARCMMVDAGLFHELGGFDERCRSSLFEVDLCLRIRSMGKKVLFDANTVMLDHASRGSKKPSSHDVKQLEATHVEVFSQCDIFYHPLLSADSTAFVSSPMARTLDPVPFRTVEVVLPRASSRLNGAGTDDIEVKKAC